MKEAEIFARIVRSVEEVENSIKNFEKIVEEKASELLVFADEGAVKLREELDKIINDAKRTLQEKHRAYKAELEKRMKEEARKELEELRQLGENNFEKAVEEMLNYLRKILG